MDNQVVARHLLDVNAALMQVSLALQTVGIVNQDPSVGLQIDIAKQFLLRAVEHQGKVVDALSEEEKVKHAE